MLISEHVVIICLSTISKILLFSVQIIIQYSHQITSSCFVLFLIQSSCVNVLYCIFFHESNRPAFLFRIINPLSQIHLLYIFAEPYKIIAFLLTIYLSFFQKVLFLLINVIFITVKSVYNISFIIL